MSMRYWFSIFAFGLTCIISLGQAQDQADNSSRKEQAQQPPSESLYPPVRIEIIKDKADARKRREAVGEKSEKADLLAQQGMETATQRMAEYAKWQNRATWLGAFLVFVSLVLMIQANKAAVDAAKAARKSITLDHPPRILLTNIAIWAEGDTSKSPPKLTPGEEISGYAWVVNAGRDTATITPGDNLLMFYWGSENLPMIRPYDVKPPHNHFWLNKIADEPLGKAECSKLKSGEVGVWESISTKVPKAYTSEVFLFVMGYIRYRTTHDAVRTLTFCRKYDPCSQSFKAIDGYQNYDLEE